VLVGLALPTQPPGLVEEHLDELAELTASAGVEVAARAVQSRRSPHARTFIGPGKAEEIGTAASSLGADLLIFDDDLSASQVRKLEDIVDRQVLDRSGLILEIFQQRAKSREALTQVELARLKYLLPRLTRRWTHLSRQVGGIGVRGGEGETQLEADRRMLRKQIQRLEKDLAKIERTRDVQRRGRRGANVVALAGYTNAGKSTLSSPPSTPSSAAPSSATAAPSSSPTPSASSGSFPITWSPPSAALSPASRTPTSSSTSSTAPIPNGANTSRSAAKSSPTSAPTRSAPSSSTTRSTACSRTSESTKESPSPPSPVPVSKTSTRH
jgi:hypothetical protein